MLGSGVFLQTDPEPGGSANNYDYCNQDPINCYDLDGRAASVLLSHWSGTLTSDHGASSLEKLIWGGGQLGGATAFGLVCLACGVAMGAISGAPGGGSDSLYDNEYTFGAVDDDGGLSFTVYSHIVETITAHYSAFFDTVHWSSTSTWGDVYRVDTWTLHPNGAWTYTTSLADSYEWNADVNNALYAAGG
jgi:hypothetical protein